MKCGGFFGALPQNPARETLHLKTGGNARPAACMNNEGFCPYPKKMLANSCGKR